jgi:hypothetical protein
VSCRFQASVTTRSSWRANLAGVAAFQVCNLDLIAMADAPTLPVRTAATPAVMRAATTAYDRARRVRTVGLAALGGGAVALAAAAASGAVGFLIAWRLRRR